MRISAGHIFLAAWGVAASTAVSTAACRATAAGTPITECAGFGRGNRAGDAARAVGRVIASGRALQGVRRYLLRDLPQPAPEDCWTGLDTAGCHRGRGPCRGVGEGRRQAPRGPDAALGRARPDQAAIDDFARPLETALDLAAEPIPIPDAPTFHRLNRADIRMRSAICWRSTSTERAAADRRGQLRLRQHRRRPEVVAAVDRALSERGPESGAARAGDARAAQRRAISRTRPARSGRAARRGCRWGRAAAPGSITSRRRDGDYVIKVRLGRGVDYDVPHFLGAQQLEVSVDGAAGEGVHRCRPPRACRSILERAGGSRRRAAAPRRPRTATPTAM